MVRKRSVISVLVLLTLSIFLFPQPVDIHIETDNIFSDLFHSPVEILMVIMIDGTRFKITNNLEDRVLVNLDPLIKENGYEYSNILIVIHNHWAYPKFSPKDLETLRRLRSKGFAGLFGIYVQTSKTVIWAKE